MTTRFSVVRHRDERVRTGAAQDRGALLTEQVHHHEPTSPKKIANGGAMKPMKITAATM